MKRTLFLALTALALLSSLNVDAKVTLPTFFSDNMVIQRDAEAAIWGTAKPGAKVTVAPSWTKSKYSTTADASTGKWMLRVQTPAAGGPYTITISDGEKLTLSNVLSGDVWFCGGQSNMEMPMKGFACQPVKDGYKKIVSAKASRPIRMCTIQRCSSPVQVETTVGSWTENTPEAVALTSAVGYYFADMVQDMIDVPIGLLISNWGGSTIETWLSREVIDAKFAGEFNMDHLTPGAKVDKNDNQNPCMLYNGQISALVPFTFKGMLWYQGESNRGREEQYVRLQAAYVEMMREKFEVPDAPFYFVQIAPYEYGNDKRFDSGFFYECQEKTLDIIPNSGMAVTTDIGEWHTIHPGYKEEVGQRLALLALQHTYGINGVTADAPRYKSVEFQGNKAVITVDTHDWEGLNPRKIAISGFEVAGEDRVFHPATGRLNQGGYQHNQIIVVCREVANPVAVRYAFRNFQPGKVYNAFGIPLAPFRTDNWDDVRE